MQVRFTVPDVIVSMTQYVDNFNLQIPYDHICRRNLKIQSRSLNLYFGTGRTFPYNFSCVNLVSTKPKQITVKKLKTKERKKLATMMLM